MVLKIAYIGIDLFFDALKALVDSGCEIAEIFTCETDNKTEFNIKICEFARENHIPCKMSRITEGDIERLKNKGIKFAVCGGYYFKIPWNTDFPIVNIHPSLLPVGRGAWPMPQTILRGYKKSGVTVHKIAEEFDAGDILLQREFELDAEETHQSFMEKVCALVTPMMRELAENFDELYKTAKPQVLGEYWEAPTPSDFTINENMTVCEADRILKAFLGYECIYKGSRGTFEIVGGRAEKGTPKNDLILKDGYIEAERKTRI